MPGKPENMSQSDWDAVESPALSEDMLARLRPAADVVPDIVAEHPRSAGITGT